MKARIPDRTRLVLLGSLLFLTIVTGCAPDVVVVSDPLFEAVLPSREVFEREMSVVARDHGALVGFVWPDAQLLDQIDYASLIAASDAPVLLLSPYASLFADELARRFPGRRFIAIRDEASESENVTNVRVDWSEGWHRAGRAVAAWLSADRDRSAIVLTNEQSLPTTADPSSFREAVEAEGEVVTIETLRSGASREAIIGSVSLPDTTGQKLVVLMMGEGNSIALEALNETSVLLAAPGAQPSKYNTRLLIGVYVNLVSVLDAYLAAPSDQSLLVPADVATRSQAEQESLQ